MAPIALDIEDGSVKRNEQLQKKNGIWTRIVKHEKTYLAIADDLNQSGEYVADNTSGVPELWTTLEGARCKSREPEERGRIRHPVTGVDTMLWAIKCMFDSEVDPSDNNDDPFLLTPKVNWTGETIDEILYQDAVTGEPVQNPNYEQYEVLKPQTMPILEIRRYEPYPWNPNIIMLYANRMNSSFFWGAPPGVAHMLPMNVSEEVITNPSTNQPQKVSNVTYRIRFLLKLDATGNLQSFTQKATVPIKGYKYRELGIAEPVTYIGETGQPELIPLKADGTRLPEGEDIQYQSFFPMGQKNFNALSLGPF